MSVSESRLAIIYSNFNFKFELVSCGLREKAAVDGYP